ncbi:MAG: hypothetical protein ACMUJM_18845 [bacterium]
MKKYRKNIFIIFSFLLFYSFSFVYAEPLPKDAPLKPEGGSLTTEANLTIKDAGSETKPDTPETKDVGSKKIREIIIRIPDSEMQYIFDIEKEGIFVTFEEYRSLYQKAKEAFFRAVNEKGGEGEGPSITQAVYQGSISGNVISFKASYKIVQTKINSALLRIPLKGVLYKKARLNGEKAHFYYKENSPRLIIPGPGSYDLSVEFDVPIDFKEKKGCITFDIPPVLFGEVTILSDFFYEVVVKNSVFTSKRKLENQFETIAFIGGESKISLEINNRRSFGEKEVRVFSDERHEAYFSRELIETFSTYTVTVREGVIKYLEIQIPKQFHVHELSGQGISGWRRESGDIHDLLKIDFYVPVSEQSTFRLRTYQYLTTQSNATVTNGAEKFHYQDSFIMNLFNRKGELFIYYAKDIRIEVEEEEYIVPFKTEPSHIPASRFDSYQLCKSYRILNLPFTLGASFQDVPSGIQSVIHHNLSIEPFTVSLISTLSLSGFQNAVTQFSFSFPDTLILRDVSASVNGYEVQEFHEVDNEKRLLFIEIKKPVCAGGTAVFTFTSECFLDEDLLRKGIMEMKIPTISYINAECTQGKLQLSLHKAFLLEDLSLSGFSPSQEMTYHNAHINGNKKILYYDFRGAAAEGVIKFSLQRPELTSEVTSYIAVDEDIMQVTAFLRYTISHGSTNSFYFAIPFWKNCKINIDGPGIKEKKTVTCEDIRKDLNSESLPNLEGFEIWNIILQDQMSGLYDCSIDFQKLIETDGSFFDVPLIMPLGVKNDSGFIVIEASRTTDISIKKTGLNEVETYELPTWTSYESSNRIIESNRYFTRPFEFQLAVLKREGLPVLSALAKRENIIYSIGKDSDIFFEYEYHIKNTNLQFLKIKLPQDHILWGATLQGKGIKPRKGKEGDLLIPLPSESEKDLNLRLIGNVPNDTLFFPIRTFHFHSAHLPIPCIDSEMQVYFPKDYAILGIKGVFESYPDWIFDTPLIMSLVRSIAKNMKNRIWTFHLFNKFAARKAPSTSIMSVVEDKASEQLFLEREEAPQSFEKEMKTEMKKSKRRLPEKRDSTVTGLIGRVQDELLEPEEIMEEPPPEIVLQQPPSEILPQQAPSPKGAYLKKKGILSLEFHIPTHGKHLAMSKLWGDNYLKILYLSCEGKRILALLNFFLVVVLGVLLYRKKIISPLVFTSTSVFIFTLLPFIGLKGLTFLFNSAALGSVCFLMLIIFKDLFIKFRKYFTGIFIFILFFISCCLFNETNALCKEESIFPDVKVYIPYDVSSPLTVDKDAQVYLPTKDYFDLKFLAEPPYTLDKVFDFENEYDITAMHVKGIVAEDRVAFTARIDIFVNHEKWILAQLPFRNAVIDSMKLDGNEIPVKIKGYKDIQLLYDIYEIPILGKGGHSLEIVFYVNIISVLGKRTIDFNFPTTLCAEWFLEINQKDILLDIDADHSGYLIEETAKGYVIKISPSLQNHIKLSWFPKKFISETEKPLIYTECDLNLFVDYDHILIEEKVAIQVEKSSIVSLSFSKNPAVKILDIFSDKVKSWSLKKEEELSIVEVVFKHEITDPIELIVKGRLKTKPGDKIPHLFFQPLGAKKVSGFLNIYSTPDFQIKVMNSENLRASELKGKKEHQNFLLKKSYSFLTDTFKAELRCIPYEKKAQADLFTLYRVSENLLQAEVIGTIHMKEGYLSHIALHPPSGYRLKSIKAEGISDTIFNQEDHHIILPFIQGLRGDFPFTMQFEKEIAHENLIVIEGIELLDMKITEGTISVLFPRGYEVRESEIVNLKSIAVGSLTPEPLSNNYKNKLATHNGAQYAYTFKEGKYRASYTISRKKPLLDVVKVNLLTVEDNLVNVRLLSIFDIKKAPLDHFIMKVPLELKDILNIQGEGIKTILKKLDTDEKNVTITVHMLSGVDRSYMMEISYNKYFGKDKIFKLPQIIFPQVRSPIEFITVETKSSYQIESKPSGKLMEIDRDMIPAFPVGINLHHVLWSYRCGQKRDWEFQITLKRLEREKLIEAKILRQDIKSVVIPQGIIIHTVLFKVRNKTLQFLPIDFPFDAEIWSVWVAGEPVRSSFGDASDDKMRKNLLIPLIKSGSGDRNFEIKLVYQSKISEWDLHGRQSLNMISTGDLAIEKTTWTLFLPCNYSYMNFKHNMNEADLTMIEADKTFELAKEHDYWRKVADSSKGEMRNKAIGNMEEVFHEYQTQQVLTKNLQIDIQRRMTGQEGDKKLLEHAQQYNPRILGQAEEMIRSSKAQKNQRHLKQEKPVQIDQPLRQRAQMKGWQFNTKDIPGQNDVQTSIDNYMKMEQDRLLQQKAAQRNLERGRKTERYDLSMGAGEEIAGRVDKDKESLPLPMPAIEGKPLPTMPLPDEVTKPRTGIMRQSILLKGMRSMDIDFPEKGIPFSFQKLGGNPHLVFSYRKKNTHVKLFYGLLLILALGAAIRFRGWVFPSDRFIDICKEKKLGEYYYLIIQSTIVKAMPTLMMALSFFVGGPSLFIVGFGLNTVLILRYISSKRYKKKGIIPSFNAKIFLKYIFSYCIITSTLFLIFHPALFICLLISTALNTLLVAIYAIVTLLTKEVILFEETEPFEEEPPKGLEPPEISGS